MVSSIYRDGKTERNTFRCVYGRLQGNQELCSGDTTVILRCLLGIPVDIK